jgi:hypothetical protein
MMISLRNFNKIGEKRPFFKKAEKYYKKIREIFAADSYYDRASGQQ